MVRLGLILIFTLQFEAGISGTATYRYYRLGDDAILPCDTASPSDTACSIFTWIYSKNQFQTFTEVENGNVIQSSARAARLSVDTKCSLVINNVTAEDVGFYTCRQGRSLNHDAAVYLSVLTLFPSPPDTDPKRDGEVTLECSLLRYIDLGPCPQNSICWVDETGTVLSGEGVRQMNCASVLTLKRQSGNNRKYTCLFVDNNKVKIEADYTPDFTGGTTNNQTETSNQESTGWSPLSDVMLALRMAALILMIIITIRVIRIRWNTKPLDDDDNESNDGNVQYENEGARPATAGLH